MYCHCIQLYLKKEEKKRTKIPPKKEPSVKVYPLVDTEFC